MDLIMAGGICLAGLLILMVFIAVVWLRNRKKGGIDLVKIKKQLEVEEPTEEPELEDSEEEVEEVQPKPQPKPQVQAAMCKVFLTGGKSFTGLYLGEDAQWLKMRTEQVPLTAFNKAHVVCVSFAAIPAPAQPVKKPATDELTLESLEV